MVLWPPPAIASQYVWSIRRHTAPCPGTPGLPHLRPRAQYDGHQHRNASHQQRGQGQSTPAGTWWPATRVAHRLLRSHGGASAPRRSHCRAQVPIVLSYSESNR